MRVSAQRASAPGRGRGPGRRQKLVLVTAEPGRDLQTVPSALVLLIDAAAPRDEALAAARTVADGLGARDSLGVMCYGERVDTLLELQAVTPAVRAAAGNLALPEPAEDPGSGIGLSEALLTALEALRVSGGKPRGRSPDRHQSPPRHRPRERSRERSRERDPALALAHRGVLLVQGTPPRGPASEPHQVLALVRGSVGRPGMLGVRVHALGLGPQQPSAMLRELAAATGGKYRGMLSAVPALVTQLTTLVALDVTVRVRGLVRIAHWDQRRVVVDPSGATLIRMTDVAQGERRALLLTVAPLPAPPVRVALRYLDAAGEARSAAAEPVAHPPAPKLISRAMAHASLARAVDDAAGVSSAAAMLSRALAKHGPTADSLLARCIELMGEDVDHQWLHALAEAAWEEYP